MEDAWCLPLVGVLDTVGLATLVSSAQAPSTVLWRTAWEVAGIVAAMNARQSRLGWRISEGFIRKFRTWWTSWRRIRGRRIPEIGGREGVEDTRVEGARARGFNCILYRCELVHCDIAA